MSHFLPVLFFVINFQIFFSLLVTIAAIVQLTHSATLRRKPKVYNALITTDQNLTPSRAFPIIQPHLQETYAYPSYSYRSYAPLGLYNNGFSYGSAAGSIPSYNHFHNYPRINTGLVEARNFFPRGNTDIKLDKIKVNQTMFQMKFITQYHPFEMILVYHHR